MSKRKTSAQCWAHFSSSPLPYLASHVHLTTEILINAAIMERQLKLESSGRHPRYGYEVSLTRLNEK